MFDQGGGLGSIVYSEFGWLEKELLPKKCRFFSGYETCFLDTAMDMINSPQIFSYQLESIITTYEEVL
jgi:hypothetical protein